MHNAGVTKYTVSECVSKRLRVYHNLLGFYEDKNIHWSWIRYHELECCDYYLKRNQIPYTKKEIDLHIYGRMTVNEALLFYGG